MSYFIPRKTIAKSTEFKPWITTDIKIGDVITHLQLWYIKWDGRVITSQRKLINIISYSCYNPMIAEKRSQLERASLQPLFQIIILLWVKRPSDTYDTLRVKDLLWLPELIATQCRYMALKNLANTVSVLVCCLMVITWTWTIVDISPVRLIAIQLRSFHRNCCRYLSLHSVWKLYI